jgi:hypothetical protein
MPPSECTLCPSTSMCSGNRASGSGRFRGPFTQVDDDPLDGGSNISRLDTSLYTFQDLPAKMPNSKGSERNCEVASGILTGGRNSTATGPYRAYGGLD